MTAGYSFCFHSQVLRPSLASRCGVFWRLASLGRVSALVTTECMGSTEAGSFVLELFHILFVVSMPESMRRLDEVVRDCVAGAVLVAWVRLDAEGLAERQARDDEAVPWPEEESGPGGCAGANCEEPVRVVVCAVRVQIVRNGEMMCHAIS